jgi:hypothetical protein
VTEPTSWFARAVRWVMRDVTYHRLYAARVVFQHADGTVDVEPEDEAMRGQGLQQVPVLVGLPGTDVRVEQGSRCLVGFENGDPALPRIMAWSYDANSATIGLAEGAAPAARAGDTVEGLITPPIVVQAVIAGTMQVPDPDEPGEFIEVTVPATAFDPPGLTVLSFGDPTPVTGVIQDGAPKVLG